MTSFILSKAFTMIEFIREEKLVGWLMWTNAEILCSTRS